MYRRKARGQSAMKKATRCPLAAFLVSGGYLFKQPQTGTGGGVVISIQLAADGTAATRCRSCQRGATASKRVHHQRIRHGVVFYEVAQQRFGLLCGVHCSGGSAEPHHIARASAAICAFAAGQQFTPIYCRFVFTLAGSIRLAALIIERHFVPHRQLAVEHQHQFMGAQRHPVCVQYADRVRLFPHPFIAEPSPLLRDYLRCGRVLAEYEQHAVFLSTRQQARKNAGQSGILSHAAFVVPYGGSVIMASTLAASRLASRFMASMFFSSVIIFSSSQYEFSTYRQALNDGMISSHSLALAMVTR